MGLTSPGLFAVTDQNRRLSYECDRSRNGSVHGSDVYSYLPVQGKVIQSILAAAPSRDHPVRVFRLSLLSPRTLPLRFLPPVNLSLGEHGSETLTSPLSLFRSISHSLIATNYLLDITSYAYCPHTWDARDAWPSRMVFTLIRDALQLERLMQICPPWSAAREYPRSLRSHFPPFRSSDGEWGHRW